MNLKEPDMSITFNWSNEEERIIEAKIIFSIPKDTWHNYLGRSMKREMINKKLDNFKEEVIKQIESLMGLED